MSLSHLFQGVGEDLNRDPGGVLGGPVDRVPRGLHSDIDDELEESKIHSLVYKGQHEIGIVLVLAIKFYPKIS